MKVKFWLLIPLVLGLVIPFWSIHIFGQAHSLVGETIPDSKASLPLGSLFEIWSDSVDQCDPVVAYNSQHNEYLVVWWNDRGASRDIYAQRVGPDKSLKSWFAVAAGAGEWYWQPALAYDPLEDEYLIVYTYRAATDDYDIKAKRISWNGSWIGPEFSIRVEKDIQWNPAVAYNHLMDEYLVVYENDWAGGTKDIDAQRVSAADGSLKAWRNIATGLGQIRWLPDVAYNAVSDQYLIAYSWYVGTDDDLYAKVASSNLGTLSNELILANTYQPEYAVDLVASPSEFLAAWTINWTPSISPSVLTVSAIRINPFGVSLSPHIPIASAPGASHSQPSVAYSPVFGFTLTWLEVTGSTPDNDIYGSNLKIGENNLATEAFALDDRAGWQNSPALACASNGSCLLVDRHHPSNPSASYDIWGRFIRTRDVYLPLTAREYP